MLIFLETIYKSAKEFFELIKQLENDENTPLVSTIMHADNPIYSKIEKEKIKMTYVVPTDNFDHISLIQLRIPYDHYYYVVCCIKVSFYVYVCVCEIEKNR